MADVIARLDAELLTVAAAGESKPPPQPVLAVRAAWCASGLLGGWMFGGALAGPAGLGYGALIGAFAGGYKAVTGRHVAELFHGGFWKVWARARRRSAGGASRTEPGATKRDGG